jgi:protein phosphatase
MSTASPLSCAGLTDRSRVRPRNEDAFFADPKEGLFIVADGMGGQAAGEIASEAVVEVLPLPIRKLMGDVKDLRTATAKERLREAICELSTTLRRQAEDRPGLQGIGSTVVVALIRGRRALIGHMGDSRAYLLRGPALEQLTKDHSVAQLLVDAGELKPDEAASHPARGQLTRFVGMAREPLPEVRAKELQPGDRLLLCTDGLTTMAPDRGLFAVLKPRRSPESLCRQFVTAANAAGGRDNITAVVVSISSKSKREAAQSHYILASPSHPRILPPHNLLGA